MKRFVFVFVALLATAGSVWAQQYPVKPSASSRRSREGEVPALGEGVGVGAETGPGRPGYGIAYSGRVLPRWSWLRHSL
jgi:hypothetical protein